MALTLAEIAKHIGGEVAGDPACVITGVATLRNAGPQDISFLANHRYRRYLAETKASAVIVSPDARDECPVHAVVVNDPYLGFARAAALLSSDDDFSPGVHATACVDANAQVDPTASIGAHAVVGAGARIGARVVIGPGCVLTGECEIGEDTRLVANVTICEGTRIGRRGLLHPGVVIGADGFGLANDAGRWIKVPQLGGVHIGDDVEIGANTTVDRGALDDTVIEDGVKLDNQIQVAHNVRIGAHTAIAGCTGIAGSAKIGRRCVIGGGVGIVGHLEIADDVQITGMSFVAHSIREAGMYSSGTPLEPTRAWRKNYARFHHLNEMAQRLRALEAAFKEFEKSRSS